MAFARIERAIDWISRSLIANRDPNPIPTGFFTEISPVVELFGSLRIEEFEVERVVGGLGSNEVTGPRVPTDSYRFYLSMGYSHDNVAQLLMHTARIVPDATLGFPILPLSGDVIVQPNTIMAIRNVVIPPDGRIAVETQGIGGASRITINNLFIELPIGEPTPKFLVDGGLSSGGTAF